jgi:hypothetical protein
MTFEFDPARLYRMPAHFGPTPGPRQGPDGHPFDWTSQPDRTLHTWSFLTDEAALEPLLPPGFALHGEPVVTVELQLWRNLAWLAGRGYNTLGVKVPARFHGRENNVDGQLLLVIWENLPDAIISGREELGYNKIYASIDDVRDHGGKSSSAARWFGHRFMSLSQQDLQTIDPKDLPRPGGSGVLNFKYIPGTGANAAPDACYVTLTPPGGHLKITDAAVGRGQVRFLPTRWEDMPTQFHIVSALAALPQLESRPGYRIRSYGARDLADQVRLS